MSKRTLLLVTALATTSIVPETGCKSEDAATTPLEVGTLASISGDLATLGQEFTDGTSLAVEEINAAGGILDRPVKLVVEDDGTSLESAKTGYAKLVAQRVPVILGPTTSAQVQHVIDLVSTSNTVTIGRTTTADGLADLEDSGYFFRIAPADATQGALLAELVLAANVEKLCLVHRRDVYGNNLAAKVKEKLASSGRSIDVTTSDYIPTSGDLSAVMAQCAPLVCTPGADAGACTPPANVGLMLITFIEDGVLILDDATKKGWNARTQRFFMSDGAYDRILLTRLRDPNAVVGTIGTSPSGPDPTSAEGEALRRFASRYKQRYGRDPSIYIENAYDGMYMAAIAMEIAKTTTPGPEIREAMAKVSVRGGRKVGAGDWATIKNAIRAGEAIDFEGASGHVNLDARGELEPPYTYVVWGIEAGQLIVKERRTITP